MPTKTLAGDCLNCESTYSIQYMTEMVSQDLPEMCPFCGEPIDELSEEYIEDEDNELGNEEWE